ncbi:NAD(P)/FAD-dependent oxidoreductase [Oryzicola mucosus]|uniref:FAD-binding oxidoreductase n=1 Tax=Oryzicola mucosus TaxID=2767425 RepID=A0A8J6U1N1_9HYPH|nr:FAD-binding oxidoreductase [Oryzicola mucosus]MBD0414658.1 FAD-binding oxidoreductase [Oryzicola mucosus]
MKRKLDLRSGTPVWFAYNVRTVATAPLQRDIKTEVAIVGMGISGAMMAEALTARGMDVVCLDRRGPLKGSTPATTALVQHEIDQPLSVLSEMIGIGKAQQAWRRSKLAVENLSSRIVDLDISCGLERRPSLYIAGNVLSPTDLKEEAAARDRAGLRTRYLTASELKDDFGIERDAALLSQGNLELDPRKLTASLLRIAAQRGARLYAPVEVGAFEAGKSGVTVATKDGPTISAQHLVIASGYELLDSVPEANHSVVSTWAIATKPQKAKLWPERAFMWEASDPYLYLRATADGRVICGGEDEDFTDEALRDELIGEKSARISEKLKRLLPDIDPEPDFAWAGSFGTTPTGLPFIGPVPRKKNVYAVMGYGGNGITFSQIASEVIAAQLSGQKDSDETLFGFNR